MHELSIVLSIIDEIGDESEAHGLQNVEVVHLKVGVFSDVERDALLFAWELACEGTSLEGSRLDIETVPLVIHCAVCRQTARRRRSINFAVRSARRLARPSSPVANSKSSL